MESVAPVLNSAGNGVNRLFDYGAAMTVLVLMLIAGGFLVYYLLKRCDDRFAASLESHQTLASKMTEVVQQNTVAITQMTENIRNIGR